MLIFFFLIAALMLSTTDLLKFMTFSNTTHFVETLTADIIMFKYNAAYVGARKHAININYYYYYHRTTACLVDDD